MAVLAAILPVVATSSSLALKLYRVAAGSKEAAKELIRVAKVVNHFALNLKQIGTIIKEDDRLPSYEVRWFPSYSICTALSTYTWDKATSTICETQESLISSGLSIVLNSALLKRSKCIWT